MGKKQRRILLTPECASTTVALATDADGLTFRKRILPVGTISYPQTAHHPGGQVTFNRKFHQDVIDAFHAKAYDAPTLQLAGPGNAHNLDPRLTYGHIIDLSHEQAGDVDGPGLYATVRALTPDHAKILRDNPKLGVSAEIKEGLRRVDGRRFKAACRHVLATLDPRLVGLGEWRAVSLAASDDDPVIDLTGTEYEEQRMPKGQGKNKGASTVLALSDEDIEAALDDAARTLAEMDGRSLEFADDDAHGVLTSLSAELGTTQAEVASVRAQLAEAQWKRDRLELSNAGVPKYVLDEAEKVLAYPGGSVIALSNEDGDDLEVDAREVIRNLVDFTRGTIDLSNPEGSGDEPPRAASDPNAAESVEAGLAAWDARSGSVD